ncbi:MauE/DoxX family redox-associated membrane protein [Paenibacillus tyrfis]|uniref:MauE/DoxX family redox-associated membrane protein n=1 Tax=Paenibacillus tyrfis TaxID=1501230 RepID=UPI0035B5151B
MTTLVLFLDILIASIFFFSFYSKVSQLTEFKAEIFSYKIIPVYFVGLAAMIVLFLELYIFLAYTFSYPSMTKELIVLTTLSLFSVLMWFKNRKSSSIVCGCFGKVRMLNKFPFRRNFLLLGVITLRPTLPHIYFDFTRHLVIFPYS